MQQREKKHPCFATKREKTPLLRNKERKNTLASQQREKKYPCFATKKGF
jgi:hypothetical protein